MVGALRGVNSQLLFPRRVGWRAWSRAWSRACLHAMRWRADGVCRRTLFRFNTYHLIGERRDVVRRCGRTLG